MLYGMEDDDYDFEEYGLTRKNKINIKKVILIITLILICLFIILFIKNIINNNNEDLAINPTTINEENIEQDNLKKVENEMKEIETEKKVAKSKKNKKEIKDTYTGNHIQIPTHNIEKIQTNFVPQFNENGFNAVKDIYYSDEKQVYLTFDDGPSKDVTPQILDILKEHDVKATFFVLGARVELYPETLKRAFNEGHYIANHGYSHKYSKIYESKDTVFQEYIECENAIKKALNNQEYNSYLFRFPGGSSGGYYESIKAEAREHFKNYGVAYTNWNCLTGDAENKTTKEECIQEMISTKADQNSIVLLMHDSNDKQQTVESLPDIIQYFKNEGYTFKTYYEIF